MALSLTTLRQALGTELRHFLPSTVGSGTRFTVVDATHPFQSMDEAGAWTDFTGWWLFRPQAAAIDRQRKVLTYHAPSGTFQVDRPYAGVPTAGEPYELWGVGLTLDQLHGCLNAALDQLFVRDRFWAVPPPDQRRSTFWSLTPPPDAAAWLTNPKWVLAMACLSEAERTTVELEAHVPSDTSYAGAVWTWRRDRTRGDIRRVQTAEGYATAGGTVAATWAAPTQEGSTLFAVVTARPGTVSAPLGAPWGPLFDVVGSGLHTTVYVDPENTVPHEGTETFTSSALPGCLTLLEYQGLHPDGLDQQASAIGNAALLRSGTTLQVAEGDELYLAVLGQRGQGVPYGPTNRFTALSSPQPTAQVANPAFHTVYERNALHLDLEDRVPSFVEGQRIDPLQTDQGQVVLYPQEMVAAPGAYLVEAVRPLSSYLRGGPTGEFGTFAGPLAEEAQETDGHAHDGRLGAIVAGALVYAWERLPGFKAFVLADPAREQQILKARHRFVNYRKASTPRMHHRFRYREPIG